MIQTPQTLFLTLAFLVPGFVLHSTVACLLPRRSYDGLNLILRYLTASCLNYALWSWLIYYLLYTQFPVHHPVFASFSWALIVLASPVALGCIIAWVTKWRVLRRLAQILGFNLVSAIPTAWDFKFSNCAPVWVLVTLKDGKRVAGWWGPGSFASDEKGERDIYISQTFKFNEKTPWKKIPDTDGILISGDQIAHIQFFNTQNDYD